MQEVKVDRSRLLSALEQNRAKHLDTYNKAMVGFRAAVVSTLEKHLKLAKANKSVPSHLNLVVPVNNVKEYDRAIKMLEFSTEEVITLTQQEFAQYVQDDWGWKELFTQSTMNYSNVKVKRRP